MLRRLFPLPLVLLAGLCGPLTAHAEVAVLTSIKPLQLIASAVQDGVGEPGVLLPASASAHHYNLRPSDLRRLQQAELFYWIGPDMETFLGDVLEHRQAASLALQELPGLKLRHFGEGAKAHDEHDHDEHEEHEGAGHEAHAAHAGAEDHDHAHRPGSLDAHLWLLPHNARVIARRMADDLVAADPANAERYRANLAGFERRLDALDTRLQQRLAKVDDKPYFVFHEAYDYFEQAYGLEHAGVFNVGGEVQPGARHVAELRQRLQQAGPSCVFSEPPLQPRLAQTLSEGLPVKLAELDPLGTDVKVDARGYERLMENLGEQLAGCLESL